MAIASVCDGARGLELSNSRTANGGYSPVLLSAKIRKVTALGLAALPGTRLIRQDEFETINDRTCGFRIDLIDPVDALDERFEPRSAAARERLARLNRVG